MAIAFVPGRWQQFEGHRGLLQHKARSVVGKRTYFHARHIAEANKAPIVRRLDNDVVELAGLLEAPVEDEVGLERGAADRGLTSDASRDLDVLGADRGHKVFRCQAVVGGAFGIDPHAHRILSRSQDVDVADALEASEHVGDTPAGVVGHEQRAAAAVGRKQKDGAQDGWRRLLGRHAIVLNRLGQPGQGHGDAVLDKHLRLVQIGTRLERNRQ